MPPQSTAAAGAGAACLEAKAAGQRAGALPSLPTAQHTISCDQHVAAGVRRHDTDAVLPAGRGIRASSQNALPRTASLPPAQRRGRPGCVRTHVLSLPAPWPVPGPHAWPCRNTARSVCQTTAPHKEAGEEQASKDGPKCGTNRAGGGQLVSWPQSGAARAPIQTEPPTRGVPPSPRHSNAAPAPTCGCRCVRPHSRAA